MPFSLSLSSYLLEASACFDREASTLAQVISVTISGSLSKLYKAKTPPVHIISHFNLITFT